MSWKRQDPGFGKDLVMTGKGGARHEPKPWVDVGLLYKCLEKHECLVADMGSYEHISSQGAPNAKALLGLKDLWVGLLELAPSGSIHSQPLRQALVSLLAEKPDMNQGKHSGGVWANLKIERFNCMLKHVRQLGRNRAALGPAVCQLTKHEYTSLLAGLEKLKLQAQEGKGDKGPEKKDAAGSGKTKRKLKQHDSEVSVDTTGLPSLFSSPFGKEGKPSPHAASSSGLEKPTAKVPKLASLQRPGGRLQAAMGYDLEKSKPGKAKGVLKRPSKSFGKGTKRPSKSFGKGTKPKVLQRGTEPGKRQKWVYLYQTDANNPPRSYIQGNVEGGKKHLIVQVTATQSPHYKAIAGILRESLEKESLTKEEAMEKRNELLAEYSPG